MVNNHLGMGEIVIDRAVPPEGAVDPPELIGFSDGSLAAYACAVYVRWRRIRCMRQIQIGTL